MTGVTDDPSSSSLALAPERVRLLEGRPMMTAPTTRFFDFGLEWGGVGEFYCFSRVVRRDNTRTAETERAMCLQKPFARANPAIMESGIVRLKRLIDSHLKIP